MEAKALHDRGVLFVDVQPTYVYEQSHIPGAIHLGAYLTEDALAEIAGKDQEMVIYWEHDGGIGSATAARAVVWGYKNIYYFGKGMAGWRAAGHPIESDE